MGASTIDTDVNDELVQIVDEENKAVKGAPRWVMRKQNLPHRSSYVFIYNSKKQLYVQMRTLTKDYLPGYYTLCTGGVVQVDEPDLVNAKREVAEEMGIENSVLNFIATKHYKDDKVDVWQNIYTLYYLSLIHISEPTRQAEISYAVFCLKKKKKKKKKKI
eukprot:TRINITY_DN2234_c0_g2_i5.p2 TRINITY_DN2234_c0_g2~~TRINITY_DN2234_c0_g2_i5.p2  ORF type:complete len:161 (-),score=55.93 TRINITY_DN2234_c0_g2_i5:19-501(-)